MNNPIRFCMVWLLAFTVTSSYAQDFSISGTVTDDQSVALESATVYAETLADSSLVSYTISNAEGKFVLEDQTSAEKINLYISFTGFQTYQKTINLSEQREIDLGEIPLSLSTNSLNEVLVKGSRAPVTIKKDTLEFNAASFKTRKDANLEEVLKELPGVSVDNDGTITVNGKEVSRIMVNGKEFFGDDPKIATKNLPKEIIDKIQVVDTKTKEEEFTGKEGDSENKTINITIEEDKNRGYFSRLTAGAGTDDRYELSGIANYFKNDLRVSLLASSNNINSSGFTFDEVFDAMGRSAYSISRSSNGSFSINGNSFGSGSGITKSDNAGFNVVNEWAKDAELNVNYFFNRADNRTETKVERENILPDRRYFNNSNSSSERQNDNHRARLSFSIEPDTLTRIYVRPNMTVNNGFSNNDSFTESFEEDGTPINNASTNRFSEVFSTDFSNRVGVTRKFGDKNGYVRLSFDNSNSESSEDEYFFSEREIFNSSGNIENTEVQDQYIDQDQQSDEYGISFGTRLPFTEKLALDVEYDYSTNKRTNARLVYSQGNDGNYSLLNEDLSNDFEARTFDHRPSLGLVYNADKVRIGISGGIQNIQLKNEDVFTGNSFDNTYNNFFSNVYARYELKQSQSIYFNYRSSRQTPSISQLQPVTNTTNPLNIITGNPNLKPSFEHRFYANFNDYDFKNRSGFYAYLGGTLTNDQVVSITTTDEDLVRTTSYTNLDGAYSLYGGASIDRTYELNETHSITLDAGLYGNFSRNLGFSNGQEFESNRQTITPDLGFEYEIKEYISFEPSYSMSIISAQYSLNNARDENYINHNAGFQVTSFWPDRLIFGSDLNYRYIGNSAPGFQNSFVLWNLSVGYEVFKDNGNVKLKVFDVLDQNTATSRNTGDDFIQDTEQLVLQQYFMLSFTYKFSKFGGKDPNKKRGGRF